MSEPIRVLHVIGIMNRGGAESMIMNLYRNIDREKVQFDFVENSFEPAAYDEEILSLGGRIFRCPHFVGKNYIQYRRWWKRFFQEHKGEYHIIHGHIGSCATIYLRIAKEIGLYTIAHCHSSYQSLPYRVMAFGTRFIADYFFGCSQEALVDRYGKHVANSDRSKVLLNAIDTEKFTFDIAIRDEVRKQLGFSSDDLVIGQVGRLMPVKNHEFTVNLFEKISKDNRHARLLLVGEGPLREKIEDQIQEKGVEDRCVLTGARADVNRLMQAMDVLIMPSVYEGLPVTLIEAQAAGLPCLLSDSITKTADITDLCHFVPLTDMDSWVNYIDALEEKRKDTSKLIKMAGYDIHGTAKWLQSFYFSVYGKRST